MGAIDPFINSLVVRTCLLEERGVSVHIACGGSGGVTVG
jgi:hypothetical protein